MKITIKNTGLLVAINNKLERNIFIKEIKIDLINISKSKTLHLGKLQKLMDYLIDTQKCNRHYYEGLVYLLENTNMDQLEEITTIDEIMEEDEYLFISILAYFELNAMNKKDGEVA